MQSKGCARWVKTKDDLAAVVSELLRSPETLQQMSASSLACHRNGAQIIGRRVLELLHGSAEPELDITTEEYSKA